MKYIIYAMICIADLSPYGMSCMNYTEPGQPSYTKEECEIRSIELGNTVTRELTDKGINVLEHIVWCIEDKKESA
jgi:hypothetical protein